MPDTPVNPYDLSTLNGVTFNYGQFSYGDGSLDDDQVGGGGTSHTDARGIEVDPNSDTANGNVTVEYINSIEGVKGGSSFKVVAVDQTYTAGFDANGYHYLPTFGTITLYSDFGASTNGFSPTANYQAPSQFVTQTLFIHGFGSDGGSLLVSDDASLAFRTVTNTAAGTSIGSATLADINAGTDHFGILSNTALGAGPTSPAYPTTPAAHIADGMNHYSTGTFVDGNGVTHSIREQYNSAGATKDQFFAADARLVVLSGNPAPPTIPLHFSNDGSGYAAAPVQPVAGSFDVHTLDGVTFGAGSLAGQNGPATLDLANSDTAAYSATFAYINGVDVNPHTVKTTVNAYTAGFTSLYNGTTIHHLPTFGSITLSNFGSAGSTNTLWVHGFSDGALLLSPYQDSTIDGNDPRSIGQSGLILSTTDLRAGPSSPAFPGYDPVTNSTSPAGYFHANAYARGDYTDSAGGTHKIILYDMNGDGVIANYDTAPKYDGGQPQHHYEIQSDTTYSGNPNPPTFPLVFTPDSTNFAAALCFAEGTRIETVRGAVAVEELVAGDRVLTAGGAPRDVVWLGQMIARPARHPRPWEVAPVRVRAHAFGPAMPERDIRLSPGHAVYVDGVLVPVGHLVNGATIVQEDVEQIRYFHVELDTHDVLLAEGLPCESYLDDGNRATFVNAAGHADLHGRLDPLTWDDACAPMVAAGPQLTSLQQRLHDQAEALGWTKSEDAGLRLVAGDTEIAPVHAAGNRLWFAVPAAATLTLRSAAGVLAHVMPGIADYRTLGIAVAELRIDGVPLDLDDAAFGSGFHRIERHEDRAWRWTDGEATLDRALSAPAMIELAVIMVAPTWQRTFPTLRAVEAA